jgi:hypothetical protein
VEAGLRLLRAFNFSRDCLEALGLPTSDGTVDAARFGPTMRALLA